MKKKRPWSLAGTLPEWARLIRWTGNWIWRAGSAGEETSGHFGARWLRVERMEANMGLNRQTASGPAGRAFHWVACPDEKRTEGFAGPAKRRFHVWKCFVGDILVAWPKGNETHGFFPFGILFFPYCGATAQAPYLIRASPRPKQPAKSPGRDRLNRAISNSCCQVILFSERFDNLHDPVTWIQLLTSLEQSKRFQNLHIPTDGFTITLEYGSEARNRS